MKIKYSGDNSRIQNETLCGKGTTITGYSYFKNWLQFLEIVLRPIFKQIFKIIQGNVSNFDKNSELLWNLRQDPPRYQPQDEYDGSPIMSSRDKNICLALTEGLRQKSRCFPRRGRPPAFFLPLNSALQRLYSRRVWPTAQQLFCITHFYPRYRGSWTVEPHHPHPITLLGLGFHVRRAKPRIPVAIDSIHKMK